MEKRNNFMRIGIGLNEQINFEKSFEKNLSFEAKTDVNQSLGLKIDREHTLDIRLKGETMELQSVEKRL